MRFPERERVLYRPNPIDQVTCFIGFPRILAIDHELPVDFQKALVERYPFLESQELGDEDDKSDARAPKPMVYEFFTPERDVAIALSGDFVAVRAEKYERWESFSSHISVALQTLLAHYTPKLFTRISLNYINIIDREVLKIVDVPWRQLIRRELNGPFGDENVQEDDIVHHHAVTEFKVDGGFVRVSTSLLTPESDGMPKFVIDNFLYTDTALDADEHKTIECLKRFNSEGWAVFQWCIEPRLHEALKPERIR